MKKMIKIIYLPIVRFVMDAYNLRLNDSLANKDLCNALPSAMVRDCNSYKI